MLYAPSPKTRGRAVAEKRAAKKVTPRKSRARRKNAGIRAHKSARRKTARVTGESPKKGCAESRVKIKIKTRKKTETEKISSIF